MRSFDTNILDVFQQKKTEIEKKTFENQYTHRNQYLGFIPLDI